MTAEETRKYQKEYKDNEPQREFEFLLYRIKRQAEKNESFLALPISHYNVIINLDKLKEVLKDMGYKVENTICNGNSHADGIYSVNYPNVECLVISW